VTAAALPVLATRRLILEPRRMADTEACLAMDREPEVTRFVPEVLRLVTGPDADPAAHRAFIEARTRGPYPPGLGYWVIRPGEEPEVFLGWVLLIPIDAEGPEIEIGWRLRRLAWGQGYAPEAAAALLRHGFATLGLSRVVADILPANLASVRVAEKIGMRPHGPTPHWPSTVRYVATRPEERIAR